ncbi:MAG: hypothetical protein ACOWWR_13380 [Eubacteriales bacterium]
MSRESKIYTQIDDTLKKYGISEDAKDDVMESIQFAEDEMMVFAFRYLSQ